MKTFLLKIDSAVYTKWKDAAVAQGMNLSEWIRFHCNVAVEKGPFPMYAPEAPYPSMAGYDITDLSAVKPGETMGTELKVKRPKTLGNERNPCKHGLLFCKKCA